MWCPYHGFNSWMRLQILYNGLNYLTMQIIDTAAGGSLSNKYTEEAKQLFEVIVNNESQWILIGRQPKVAGLHEIDTDTTMAAKVGMLT